MKYQDKIVMVKRGGSSRNGPEPDRLIAVTFVRIANEPPGYFEYLHSPADNAIGKGKIDDIVTVNGNLFSTP